MANTRDIKDNIKFQIMKKERIVRIERQAVGRTESQTGMYRKSWQSNEYVYGARLQNGKTVDIPREEIVRQTGRKRIKEALLTQLVGYIIYAGSEIIINLAFKEDQK